MTTSDVDEPEGKTLDEIIDDTVTTLWVIRPTWIRVWLDLRARVVEIVAELEQTARAASEQQGGGESYASTGCIRVDFDPDDGGGLIRVSVLMGTLWDLS